MLLNLTNTVHRGKSSWIAGSSPAMTLWHG
jgi:hypothetical protein